MVRKPGTVVAPCGPVLVDDDGVLVRARGIPYATAERFAAPVAVPDWQTPVNATVRGPACPQKESRLTGVFSLQHEVLEAAVAADSRREADQVLVVQSDHAGLNLTGILGSHINEDAALGGILCVGGDDSVSSLTVVLGLQRQLVAFGESTRREADLGFEQRDHEERQCPSRSCAVELERTATLTSWCSSRHGDGRLLRPESSPV